MQSSQDPVADVFDAYVPDGVRRGEVDRGDRVLRWVEAGTGTPTVVLESGAASNALTWLASSLRCPPITASSPTTGPATAAAIRHRWPPTVSWPI
jgi:hypothetical protein